MRAANEVVRMDRAAFHEDGARAFFALDRPGNEVSPAYVRHVVDQALTSSARAAQAVVDLVTRVNLGEETPKPDVPVLVVHGTHDISAPLPLTGRRAADLVPGSTLEFYEDAGHGLCITHAEQLTADLREFTASPS